MPRRSPKKMRKSDPYGEGYEVTLSPDEWAALKKDLDRARRRQQRQNKAKKDAHKTDGDESSATPEVE